MTTATADVTIFIPSDIAKLSPREIGKLAEATFPKLNALTRIWHRVLVNWCRAAYHDRCGTRWLVKTADEFMTDLPYSRATIYRALKTFEEMGLIVKRQAPHIYARAAGKDHCNWIALRYRGRAGYGWQDDDLEAIDAKCVNHMIDAKCSNHTSFTENSSEENSPAVAAGESETVKTSSQEQELSLTSSKPAGVFEMSKPKQTLQEILDNRKVVEAEKLKTQGEQPLTALELARSIQTSRRRTWPNEPPMSVSRKDLALLKQFIAKGRELKFTDNQLRAAVQSVALSWDNFRAQVLKRTGRKLPERPQVITFTWQFDEVVLFARENAVETSAPVPAGKSMSELFGKN